MRLKVLARDFPCNRDRLLHDPARRASSGLDNHRYRGVFLVTLGVLLHEPGDADVKTNAGHVLICHGSNQRGIVSDLSVNNGRRFDCREAVDWLLSFRSRSPGNTNAVHVDITVRVSDRRLIQLE